MRNGESHSIAIGQRATGTVVLGLALLVSGCQSPPPVRPGQSVPVRLDERFDDSRAWHHLVELSDLGPRTSGSRGARRARRYLTRELHRSGFEVEEVRISLGPGPGLEAVADGDRELVHLQLEIPGPSDDLVLLAARYDTPQLDGFDFVGANSGASGPALLLELARVLKDAKLPYTHRIVFVDGDAIAGDDGVAQLFGSRALAESLSREGELERLRLAVFFDQIGDARLAVARDLRSHRVYREAFWDSARELGFESVFAPDAALESPVSSHRAFLDRGLRQVVALLDTHYGDGDAPGQFWHTAQDTPDNCSQESLSAAGRVSLAGLARIERRLAQIDRFAQSPIDFEPDPDPAPPVEPSATAEGPNAVGTPNAAESNPAAPRP